LTFARRKVGLVLVSHIAAFLLIFSCLALAQSQPENATTFSQFRPRKEIPGESFAGSAACLDCHGVKAGSYSATSMAHALSQPSQSAALQAHSRLTFNSGRFSYEIVSDGPRSLYRISDGNETIEEPLLYAFGNAHIAQTYIFRRNGRLYEGRVSYYSAINGLDWTIGDALDPPPDLPEAAGRDISGDEARNCFSCHGTAATAGNKLRLDHLIAGVGCEACHGPGARHIAAATSGSRPNPYIFNPKVLDAETLSQEFCGACHRSVDTVAMMPNLNGINNVRFQPYRLYNSRGHDPRDPRLTCTACHDPHVELKQADPAYNSNCITCHQTNSPNSTAGKSGSTRKATATASIAKPCPVANDRCVTCHMPKVDLPGAHFQFTDHRIRIVHAGEPYPY
jgi:Cytochrome c3